MTDDDDAAFRLCGAQLWVRAYFVCPAAASLANISADTSTSLVFTTHKNGLRGEVIDRAYSGAAQ
jgi:hypothetical protein